MAPKVTARRSTRGRRSGSVAKFDFWGKIQKSSVGNSMTYRLPNSRKSNFATEPNILRRHHLEPAPQRRQAAMSWAQFLKLHWEVLAATNFFTVEVATWHGLVTYYVLVVMEVATRCVHIAGITPHPTDAFMQQCARQLTDPFEGFLLGKRYLIHDRDTQFTQAFDGLLKGSGVEPIRLPARSPNLNAHCERFVRSSKEEALKQMVILGERALYYTIHQ